MHDELKRAFHSVLSRLNHAIDSVTASMNDVSDSIDQSLQEFFAGPEPIAPQYRRNANPNQPQKSPASLAPTEQVLRPECEHLLM